MRVGPLRRNDLVQTGWPVVAGREAPEDRTRPRPSPVTHEFASLSYYVGGRAHVEQHGEWHLGPGDVLVVPAGAPHRMLATQRSEYWGLALRTPSFVTGGASELLAPFERVRDGAASVVHVPAPRQEFLAGLFRELELSTVRAAPSGTLEAVQRSLLTLILAEVDRAGGDAPAPRARGKSVVTESLRYIERNCLRRLTLGEIAEAVGRSPTYVTAALTQATGKSAGDWIVAGRMAEARRLILSSDERVDVIAERVGYADATHFIRMFRRLHGATPAAWRARNARPPAQRPPSRASAG